MYFQDLVTSFGKTGTNFFSWSLDPLRPILYILRKLFEHALPWAQICPQKSIFVINLYFSPQGGNFIRPSQIFRPKIFRVLFLNIIWKIHVKMSKIWDGHFLILLEIACFSEKMSLKVLCYLQFLKNKKYIPIRLNHF